MAFTNLNQLTDRILIRPVFPGHGLVDDDHAGRACGVAVAEVAAPDDGNFENIKVARRSADPARASGELIFAQWTPDNVEGQPVAGFERQAAGEGRALYTRDGVEALAAIARELGDSGGLLVAVADERHLQREHVVTVEAGIDVAQSDERADEERSANEKHQRKRNFADDQ